jgi:hypothetical protein
MMVPNTLPVIALFFSSAAFSQTITLAPLIGPPNTSTQVSGSGFSPSDSIEIYFDTTSLAMATADGTGSFSGVAIEVPASALPGAHTVSAEASSGATANATFTVCTDWRELGFGPAHTGHNPYENVLNPSNVGSLELKWSYATGNSDGNALVMVNGVVYDNFLALKASTGALLWNLFPGETSLTSSPSVVNGSGLHRIGRFDHVCTQGQHGHPPVDL